MADSVWWKATGRTMPPAHALGRNVDRLYRARGWDQKGLARRLSDLGIPAQQNTVSRIITASRPVSVDELVALAHLLRADNAPFDELEPAGLLVDPAWAAADWEKSWERVLTERRARIADLQSQRDVAQAQLDEALQELAQLERHHDKAPSTRSPQKTVSRGNSKGRRSR